jgi:hypothetical protein
MYYIGYEKLAGLRELYTPYIADDSSSCVFEIKLVDDAPESARKALEERKELARINNEETEKWRKLGFFC